MRSGLLCARTRRTALLVSYGVVLAFAAQVRAGEARTPELVLEWSAPRECPDGVSVRSQVLRLLRDTRPQAEFLARAQIRSEASGYELELQTSIDGHRGVRRVHDASCEALANAAAVVIALAVDPTLELDAKPPPASSDGATGEPPLATSSVDVRPRAPEPAPLPPLQLPRPPAAQAQAFGVYAELAVLGETGTVPGFAPGAALALELRIGRALFGVGAEYLLPQRTTLPDSEIGALIGYFGVRAFGCVGAFEERLAPVGCAGVAVGRLTGESRGAPEQGEGSLRWITPELGGALRYRLTERLLLQAGATLRIALEDSEFTLENLGAVYSPDWVALAVHTGLVVRIW